MWQSRSCSPRLDCKSTIRCLAWKGGSGHRQEGASIERTGVRAGYRMRLLQGRVYRRAGVRAEGHRSGDKGDLDLESRVQHYHHFIL